MAPKKARSTKVFQVLLVAIVLFSTFFTVHGVLAEDYYNKDFEWSYRGYTWTWSLSIPQSLYNAYKRVSVNERTKYGDYSFLVTTRDAYVKAVANKLHEAATQKGYGAFDEVSFILAFVQSLPYTSDSVTTRYDEYPRFPIETLVDDGGDCEDTAILFATLVMILDYDTIFISPPNHLAVGVWGEGLGGHYFTYNSKTYYYCETTGENWNIGDMPDAYIGVSATLYSIEESGQCVPSQDTSPVPTTPGQGDQTTPFFQPAQVLGIMVTGFAALIVIAALVLWARSKVPKPEEPIPIPPAVKYPPDVGRDEETKKTVEQTRTRAFFCRYCGAENKADAVFCEKCGKKIG